MAMHGLYGIMWFVWLERNACIFEGVSLPINLLWDRIIFMVSPFALIGWPF